jgi:hypothetical protein
MQICNNISRVQTTTAADPTVARETAYFKANISKVTTAADFINNYQLFSYAMKAYGLSDMTYAKGLMQKVLDGGVSDSNSFANKLSDPRFKAFATAFDFTGKGAAAVTSSDAQATTVSKFIQQTLEDNEGQQNEGVQLALYFQRQASSIKDAYSILGDKALLQVVQTALGIPAASSAQDIDLQAQNISSKLNVQDFQDPAKVQKFLQKFSVMWDMNNPSSSSSASTPALLIGQTSIGFSTDLLMSLQNLKIGGM